ncbi:MAG: Uma2 family endonuclease, partial [Dolichospermum sp.]
VVNRANLPNEKRWKKESILSLGESIPLIIEIVSTNWRDDYHLKYADYEEMGIAEYWIIDYAALGGRNFIGNPKQPTISVCNLVDGEYQISKFRDDERVISQTFPELNLTANQILKAGMM